MKQYDGLGKLLDDIEQLHWDAWIYCNIEKWNRDPLSTTFYYVTEDEALDYEVDDEGNPSFCEELDIQPFFEMQTFKDIVEQANQGKTDVVKAINYYREYDTFIPAER